MAHFLETLDTISDISEVELLLREYLSWVVLLFNAQNNLDVDVDMDLSRFCAAPCARLGHLPFESDRAFPAQC